MQDVVFVYWPSIIGSCGFSFASFVYVAEVTHSLCVLVPERLTFGYFVAISNLVGSLLFLLAWTFYLVAREPWEMVEPWEYYVSEWGTRFTFAVGRLCLLCAGRDAQLPRDPELRRALHCVGPVAKCVTAGQSIAGGRVGDKRFVKPSLHIHGYGELLSQEALGRCRKRTRSRKTPRIPW